ncbi:hypothetical protein JFL43_16455 [Viridibacillus sp. YIM B01967]|uniref:Reverse transcriptase domain-containing protein n=1 Tax=Viridibacillus soli TaxID=2798301 RepID=A0ABS1HAI1_9BACL|nr:hypothetical protein [Viridibacillus soli]
MALHCLESLLNIRYRQVKRGVKIAYENRGKYVVARYADDFVIMCESKEDAENLYQQMKSYLETRGHLYEECCLSCLQHSGHIAE